MDNLKKATAAYLAGRKIDALRHEALRAKKPAHRHLLLIVIGVAVAFFLGLLMGSLSWGGEETGKPDFGLYYAPGDPNSPCAYGGYRYAYGTPENHTSEIKCNEPPKEPVCRWELDIEILYPKFKKWWDHSSPVPPDNAIMTWKEIMDEAIKRHIGWDIDKYFYKQEQETLSNIKYIEIWFKRKVCE